MEIFQPLTDFYNAINKDMRISTTHISLYLALLQKCNVDGGTNPFFIVRAEVMKKAKINSRHTYNKRMHELATFGYIKYIPTSHHFSGSLVYLNQL